MCSYLALLTAAVFIWCRLRCKCLSWMWLCISFRHITHTWCFYFLNRHSDQASWLSKMTALFFPPKHCHFEIAVLQRCSVDTKHWLTISAAVSIKNAANLSHFLMHKIHQGCGNSSTHQHILKPRLYVTRLNKSQENRNALCIILNMHWTARLVLTQNSHYIQMRWSLWSFTQTVKFTRQDVEVGGCGSLELWFC